VLRALIAAGWAVPTKTKAGVKEAVSWEAFKRFLSNMSPGEAEKYKQQFAHWLPYAVTLGIEKDFVKKFAAANAPKPKWWGRPKEKSLNVGLDQAYVWVSASVVEAESQPKPAQTHSKSTIRRLGQSNGETSGEELLKPIQSTLMAFLKDGFETSAKRLSSMKIKGLIRKLLRRENKLDLKNKKTARAAVFLLWDRFNRLPKWQ